MDNLIFATSNDQKFLLAKHACEKYSIALSQVSHLETTEIQSESGEPIARHKASETFAKLQQPIVITDDTWVIPGLNGFPGPYMKSMNHWFSTQDWLNLTKNLTDRRVFLRQILVYQDELEQVLFSVDVEGMLLSDPRGSSANTNQPIMSFDKGEHSIAEMFANNKSAIAHKHNAWDEFGAWFTARQQ